MALRAILLDTNAYAAFKRGAADALAVIQHAPQIGISSTVLGELLAGFSVGSREADNVQELQKFLQSERVKLYPVDGTTAEHYAKVYRSLRQKGHPIPTNDMWIAATALQHGLTIFTYDHHFAAIDGIVIGSRMADFQV